MIEEEPKEETAPEGTEGEGAAEAAPEETGAEAA